MTQKQNESDLQSSALFILLYILKSRLVSDLGTT